MPKIRRTNHHRINVFIQQHLPVIVIHLHIDVIRLTCFFRVIFLNQLLRLLRPMTIQIAHRHDPRLLMFPRSRQIMGTRNTTTADLTYIDFVAWGIFSTQHMCWNDRRKSKGTHGSQGYVIDKFSPFHALIDMLVAFFCAINASSVDKKQCACVIAVSVRFNTSSTSNSP